MWARLSAFWVTVTLCFSLPSAWPEEPLATLAYDKPDDATEQEEGAAWLLSPGPWDGGAGFWVGGPWGSFRPQDLQVVRVVQLYAGQPTHN